GPERALTSPNFKDTQRGTGNPDGVGRSGSRATAAPATASTATAAASFTAKPALLKSAPNRKPESPPKLSPKLSNDRPQAQSRHHAQTARPGRNAHARAVRRRAQSGRPAVYH